ncbi:MAG: hypothetical protein J3R72DRAFT_153756 [Linnemannia gamsii]|nr:MAG: hypothetical protein J3R72DRAFT_153756 [Linnemannia gamsii]
MNCGASDTIKILCRDFVVLVVAILINDVLVVLVAPDSTGGEVKCSSCAADGSVTIASSTLDLSSSVMIWLTLVACPNPVIRVGCNVNWNEMK